MLLARPARKLSLSSTTQPRNALRGIGGRRRSGVTLCYRRSGDLPNKGKSQTLRVIVHFVRWRTKCSTTLIHFQDEEKALSRFNWRGNNGPGGNIQPVVVKGDPLEDLLRVRGLSSWNPHRPSNPIR